MNSYWHIATSSDAFIRRFISLSRKIDGQRNVRLLINVVEKKIVSICTEHGIIIDKFTSESTVRQYIAVWASLGFVWIENRNCFFLNTDLCNDKDLIALAKIYLLKPSQVLKTSRYRVTIMINVLYTSGSINWTDIEKKRITKIRGSLTPQVIKSLIGNFEKELSLDKAFLKKTKERYDEQF